MTEHLRHVSAKNAFHCIEHVEVIMLGFKRRMVKKSLALEVYKPSEVAEMLRVDMRTIYGMIGRGELPQIKVGRLIRIPRGPVDILLGRKPAVDKGAR